jgi:hypothetical protein
VVTICTTSLTLKNSTFCPHTIFVFCIYLKTNSEFCHLQHKLVAFITEMKSVYSTVRILSLNIAACYSSFKIIGTRKGIQERNIHLNKIKSVNHTNNKSANLYILYFEHDSRDVFSINMTV